MSLRRTPWSSISSGKRPRVKTQVACWNLVQKSLDCLSISMRKILRLWLNRQNWTKFKRIRKTCIWFSHSWIGICWHLRLQEILDLPRHCLFVNICFWVSKTKKPIKSSIKRPFLATGNNRLGYRSIQNPPKELLFLFLMKLQLTETILSSLREDSNRDRLKHKKQFTQP